MRPTENLVTLHMLPYSIPYLWVELLVYKLTQHPRWNSVNHVPRPSQSINCSQSKPKHMPPNMENEYIGTSGVLPQSKVLMATHMAAQIDDVTHETKLHFQKRKRETFSLYVFNEAYIETQTGNSIKACQSDCGGEFLSKEITHHQDKKGTVHELTVHDSPPQNGTVE